jgi:hypothetical protein
MSNAVDEHGRRLIHQRQIECCGYLRADGLWDIEGRLRDSKTHSVLLSEGRTVEAGEVYHGMLLRVTIDDEFTIREVAIDMPQVPTSECRGAAPAYERLVGLRMGPGFTRQCRELFGGTGGCVHLTELLPSIATTAFQTIPLARAQLAPRDAHDSGAFTRATGGLINTCHALRATGPIALAMKK